MLCSMFYSIASTTTVASCHHRSSLLLPHMDLFAGASRSYARAKTPKTTNNEGNVMVKAPHTGGSIATSIETSSTEGVNTAFELPTNLLPFTYDLTLDIGPSSHPLCSFTDSFAPLTHKQANTYTGFGLECNAMLLEGILHGMKEFKDTHLWDMMVW